MNDSVYGPTPQIEMNVYSYVQITIQPSYLYKHSNIETPLPI
ncbi:hypothetical protein JOC83_000214 [Bacillus iocasae]|uniref:Uncharacterized protein n=1 Tax=Priestia iocasae TaxID=2291674 RepID=A0ABS2QQ96_9BACI|nr:hypothetical protein [Metabacillus iocasae]